MWSDQKDLALTYCLNTGVPDDIHTHHLIFIYYNFHPFNGKDKKNFCDFKKKTTPSIQFSPLMVLRLIVQDPHLTTYKIS